jgi:hypothetical protein
MHVPQNVKFVFVMLLCHWMAPGCPPLSRTSNNVCDASSTTLIYFVC